MFEERIKILLIHARGFRPKQHSLKHDWQQSISYENGLSAREKTFMVICDRIKNQSFPGYNLTQPVPEELVQMKKLGESIQASEGDNNYKQCKFWCCFVIENRCTFWKSVLKVVVQFMDLWIEYGIKYLIMKLCLFLFLGK